MEPYVVFSPRYSSLHANTGDPLAGLTGDGRERRRRAADGEGSLQLQAEQRGRAVVQQRRHDRRNAAGGGRLVGGHAQRQNRLVSQQLRPRDQTVR